MGACALVPRHAASVFLALAESITHQQLSGTAAMTIWRRVVALYGSARGMSPTAVLATPERVLREAGLSGAKVAALHDLASHALIGTVPTRKALEQMDDEAIIERLVQVRGVGRWTVEMLLIFRLGRPDVLPVADLGVKKGFQRVYGLSDLPDADEMARRAEAWRPWRSVGTWYMWRATEVVEG